MAHGSNPARPRGGSPPLPRLRDPARIQQFLDETPYSTDPFYRCPRSVVRDRRAHCVDGALFAAACLERIDHPPQVVDLRAVRDDDHVIAIYRRRGCLGAIAKSNVVGLRFREPIYRSLRELAMSYFEVYYNTDGEKTLRSHSLPVDLRRFDRLAWRESDDGLPRIVAALDSARHVPLLDRAQIAALHEVDRRTYCANLLGTDPAGLYAGDRLRHPIP